MFEVLLLSIFTLLTLCFVVNTKKMVLKQNKACNIVIDIAKLKSDNFSIDDSISVLKNCNAKIVYNCLN